MAKSVSADDVGNFNMEFLMDIEIENERDEAQAEQPGRDGDASQLRAYIEAQRNASTAKKTRKNVERFMEWMLHTKKEKRQPHDILPTELDILIGGFILSLVKSDGSEYEPDTLTAYHGSIDRWLRDHGYQASITHDRQFETSRNVLSSKRKELKSKGLGNKPNKAEPLTPEEEDLLWSTGQMGTHSPRALRNAVWFSNTKYFGFRGNHENRQLKWGDIVYKTDSNGSKYLQFNERLAKTRQGNSAHMRAFDPKIWPCDNEDRCPIKLYEAYMSHRPVEFNVPEAPFYLSINHKRRVTSVVWYSRMAVGEHELARIVPLMAKSAGIPGKKTNHSIRKTMCTNLLHAGVPPTVVAQLSGHKNIQSLMSYSVASNDQQKEMYNILSGNTRSRLPAITDGSRNTHSSPIPGPVVSARPMPALPPATTLSTGPLTFTKTAESTVATTSAARNTAHPNSALAGMFAGANITGGNFTINLHMMHSQVTETNIQSSQSSQ